MPKAMIVTVGTGETVAHGICCSIRQQNPDYIIFLLTQESKEKTLPLILQDDTMQGKKAGKEMLTDENDVEEIRCECQKVLERLIKERYNTKDIVVDYTSGTKAMSVGLVLAALDKRVGTLVYVSGKRDKNGRVISGTERPIPIEPNRTYADLLFKDAVSLFNTCQFDACLGVVTQVENMIAESSFQKEVDLLKKLAQAYSSWDKFNLSQAFSLLDNLSDNSLMAKWGIKSRVGKNKEILFGEKEGLFCLERIADLLENARRRGDIEKKYDDACARLYRLIEYIAQFQINMRELYIKNESGQPETDNLDIAKLPSELQEKYIEYKDPKDNKIKLGLYQNYELLFDLGDNLGKLFKEQYERGELKKLLSLRNNSILAHGFGPISEETYIQMLRVSEKIITSMFSEINNIVEKVKFPQIKV